MVVFGIVAFALSESVEDLELTSFPLPLVLVLELAI